MHRFSFNDSRTSSLQVNAFFENDLTFQVKEVHQRAQHVNCWQLMTEAPNAFNASKKQDDMREKIHRLMLYLSQLDLHQRTFGRTDRELLELSLERETESELKKSPIVDSQVTPWLNDFNALNPIKRKLQADLKKKEEEKDKIFAEEIALNPHFLDAKADYKGLDLSVMLLVENLSQVDISSMSEFKRFMRGSFEHLLNLPRPKQHELLHADWLHLQAFIQQKKS